jgi:hypothetical protein
MNEDLNLFRNILIAYCIAIYSMAFISTSCSKKTDDVIWEDRPGINVEGDSLEEACMIARQRISECLFEGKEHDGSLVYLVDWENRCNENTVLRYQWIPCEEVKALFPGGN